MFIVPGLGGFWVVDGEKVLAWRSTKERAERYLELCMMEEKVRKESI